MAQHNLIQLAALRRARTGRASSWDTTGRNGVLMSADGGYTWPEFARKTDIPNPGSKATLYGLGGDTVALLHNPTPKHHSPLALWNSYYGLKSWPYRRVLVPESSDGP